MRIIGGRLGGRVIKVIDSPGLRPATGRVREALFSMLAARGALFHGARVLDCYAGAGSVGIEALSRGAGKAVFIEGALPGEEVSCRITRSKKHFDEAETVAVLQASDQREAPRCPHFSVCGGCVLQHARHEAQVAYKQRVLEEQLQRYCLRLFI